MYIYIYTYIVIYAQRPCEHARLLRLHPALEVTQGQIPGQSPTDTTRFWWHLYRS